MRCFSCSYAVLAVYILEIFPFGLFLQIYFWMLNLRSPRDVHAMFVGNFLGVFLPWFLAITGSIYVSWDICSDFSWNFRGIFLAVLLRCPCGVRVMLLRYSFDVQAMFLRCCGTVSLKFLGIFLGMPTSGGVFATFLRWFLRRFSEFSWNVSCDVLAVYLRFFLGFSWDSSWNLLAVLLSMHLDSTTKSQTCIDAMIDACTTS